MIYTCRGHLPQFCPPVDQQQRLVKVGLSNVVVCIHVLLATLVSKICVQIAYGSYQLISHCKLLCTIGWTKMAAKL
jgi:hypothetical protein